MNFDRLRQLLLEKALNGTLVPQLPNEPAVTLMASSPVEKNLSSIPQKWRWVRFGDVCNCLDGKRIPLKKQDRAKLKKLYPYFGATGIIDQVDQFILTVTSFSSAKMEQTYYRGARTTPSSSTEKFG